jgi:[protein-PII] uridylyltransferase
MSEARKQLDTLYADIGAMFDRGESGGALVRHMCAGVDRILVELWQAEAPTAAKAIDLVAVGGYGRGELAPFSDWDIWFLVPEKIDDVCEQELQSFLYALWDMNVKIGHAVRSVKETLAHVREEWESATAAMESRLLAGNGAQYNDLQAKLASFFKRRRKAFVEAKFEELRNRHARCGNTAFLMEPDIKEGQGGLRDVQAVFWMAKAWYAIPEIAGLVAEEALSGKECGHLLGAQDFLWRCRTGLHLELKRGGDRLGFEQQAQLAERMGYERSESSPAVDAFMKDYFRHAGRIARVSGLLMMHFNELLHPQRFVSPRVIGDGFVLEGQRVGIVDDNVFQEEPLRMLRVFHVAQQDHRRLSSHVLRQIREDGRLIDDAFRDNPEAHRIFLDILRHPRNVAWALKEMNDTGVLGRFIPEFREVVGLGQFNRYHAYTVDEHTIRAVGEARNMFHHDRETRLPLAEQIWKRLKQPELLYLALIFHDIAKSMPGDHSVNGEVLARNFCKRIGLSNDETALVAWLVREHLTMAMTSQRSDLSDHEVIKRFAAHVGDKERLNYLLVLTVADIAAVGPNIWNDWKGALLQELYQATARQLLHEESAGEALKARVVGRIEAVRDLADEGEREALSVVLEALPWRCVMQFPAAQLLALGHMLQGAGDGEAIEIHADPRRSETVVMVAAKERSRLFAALTSVLATGHVNIIAAQAFEISHGRVLDVFHVQGPDGGPLQVQADIDRLKARIAQTMAEDKLTPPAKVSGRNISVLMRQVPVSVRELPLASTRQTAIEVTAADRQGLLARFAYVISAAGYDLKGAAISTFGERVVDVFFVEAADAARLTQEQVNALARQLADVAVLPEDEH